MIEGESARTRTTGILTSGRQPKVNLNIFCTKALFKKGQKQNKSVKQRKLYLAVPTSMLLKEPIATI